MCIHLYEHVPYSLYSSYTDLSLFHMTSFISLNCCIVVRCNFDSEQKCALKKKSDSKSDGQTGHVIEWIGILELFAKWLWGILQSVRKVLCTEYSICLCFYGGYLGGWCWLRWLCRLGEEIREKKRKKEIQKKKKEIQKMDFRFVINDISTVAHSSVSIWLASEWLKNYLQTSTDIYRLHLSQLETCVYGI